MNRVGILGRGESVWLAFFRRIVIRGMLPVLRRYGETESADRLAKEAEELRAAAEKCFDGEGYPRGFFDDGEKVGAPSERFFLLPQAFAVLSGEKNGPRAMENAISRLYDEKNRLLLLFSPPFGEKERVGYISRYCDGVRENGGQYTHAALWGIRALCRMGKGEEAWKLFAEQLPFVRAKNPEYGAEPYFTAADIFSSPGLEGRAGWTGYSGSAGWMLRVFYEDLLGFRKMGREFSFSPLSGMPFDRLCVSYRSGQTQYRIIIESADRNEILLDNLPHSGLFFLDKKTHEIKISLAKRRNFVYNSSIGEKKNSDTNGGKYNVCRTD